MSKPIIPWIGGKRRLAKWIIPLLGEHRTYVEPFAGGAAVFMMKDRSRVEVINDINSDLVTLYRVVRNHLEEFVRHYRYALISREEFLTAKRIDPSTLTDIQRAARFYYLQRLAFGGKVEGRTFGVDAGAPPRLNLLRIEEELSQAHLRLARAKIEHLPWQECVRRYDRKDAVQYLDPPYWGTEGYDVDFGLEQYDAMAELARSIKGRMVISVNDIPEMREAFDGLPMESIPKRAELLIRSWQ